MAKKKVAATEVVVEQPAVAPVKTPTLKNKKPDWEYKDRTYFLKDITPLTYIMKSKGIIWFDEEKGYNREVMATENQRTVFVDEMQGVKRPARIIFRDGVLTVPKSKPMIQKILSIYHPGLDSLYYEYKPTEEAKDEVANIELELEALNAAVNLDIDMAEAIMRVEIGSEVSNMNSKELKRDLLLFAKRNPVVFLELVDDDNIHLRNIGIKATERNIISLSSDRRSFLSSTGAKLMTIPFDTHPYTALAQWFKTDEGMDVLSSIEKRLK
tara:strand:+ start:4171 stop:4977 length:807 start_codon:yes stop_codon:yes gene_type:complete